MSTESREEAARRRIELAQRAAERFGHPASTLRTVAVTGTNGKTTTVHILRALLDDPGAPAASIGTLGVLMGASGTVIPGGLGLTTPGPDELQRVLRELVDMGVRSVAMEVSSHALDQHRVHGVTFDAAVFTNFTRDHLDYHGSMEAYFAAKAALTGYVRPGGTSVVNAEEASWSALPDAGRRLTFGVRRGDVTAADVQLDPGGSSWTLCYGTERLPVRLPLLGEFNIANALGAAAAAIALGIEPHTVTERLTAVPQVPGRLERIAVDPVVLRDYAHTPDSIEHALRTLRPFVPGRLIVVFGAGGDRDPGKRPMMGAAAERGADVVIVSSDNPRTEPPDAIVNDIERGMTRPHLRIVDRRAAITHALELAGVGDLVLLAGKGHETYQVVGNERIPFDEKEIVTEILGARA